MKNHIGIFVLAILIAAALLLNTITFAVDETKDVVLVKTFGNITGEPMQGSEYAGLHLKWPWPIQKTVRYDSRIFTLESPSQELQTADRQNVIVTTYCSWRIKDAAKFHNSITPPTYEAGEQTIRSLLQSIETDVLPKYPMSALINTDPDAMKLKDIADEVKSQLAKQAFSAYGIVVTDVGIKALGFSEGTSQRVLEVQMSDLAQEAEKYRAQGTAQAEAIRNRAQSAREKILAFARRKASLIRADGVRAAAEYYPVFQQNEALSMFLRSLESLRKDLQGRTTLVLDSSRIPALEFFYRRPSLDGMGPADSMVGEQASDRQQTPSEQATGGAEESSPVVRDQ